MHQGYFIPIFGDAPAGDAVVTPPAVIATGEVYFGWLFFFTYTA